MAYRTDWEPRGVVWTFSGDVTAHELLQANLEIYGDPRFDNIRFQICDFLVVENMEVSGTDLRKIAYLDVAAAKTNPRVKVAIVSDMDLIKDYTTIYATFAERSPWETQVFGTMAEARAWIDANAGE